MSGSKERLIVNLETAYLSAEDRQKLWNLLVDFALESGAADEFSIDEALSSRTVPDVVTQARQELVRGLGGDGVLLQGGRRIWRRTFQRWPLDATRTALIRVLGPHVLSLTLWKEGSWMAGAFDGGDGMAMIVSGEQSCQESNGGGLSD